jgi:ABC-type nitrate/sulfonate/bicarbonate transport system substrate-binding protein
VVLAAITTGLPLQSYAQTQSPIAVRAAYIPVVTWLPAWVAKEKGFFAAHGLDAPFPTYRLAIKPQDIQVWAAALRDIGQLDKEVDSSKLVVTP